MTTVVYLSHTNNTNNRDTNNNSDSDSDSDSKSDSKSESNSDSNSNSDSYRDHDGNTRTEKKFPAPNPPGKTLKRPGRVLSLRVY